MTPQDAETIASVLERHFNADVDLESINGNGRYRFAMISQEFSDMPVLRRQDAVWAALRSEISDDITIDVLSVYTLSPEEFAESGGPV